MNKVELFSHKPVLLNEVLSLVPATAKVVVDFTLGLAGHSIEILKRNQNCYLFGFDRDYEALSIAQDRLSPFKTRVNLKQLDFKKGLDFLLEQNIKVDFCFADLGVSSLQLDKKERGFSFQQDAPLDMRMDVTQNKTAADFINSASLKELTYVFKTYGEEKLAYAIARSILKSRSKSRIETTFDVVNIIDQVKFGYHKKYKIHPATLIFQALRIYVNEELDQLSYLLQTITKVATKGSVLAVISFHSLEDRLVKKKFVNWFKECICDKKLPICVCKRGALAKSLTNGLVRAQKNEVYNNPRSGSAKLRAVEFF